jgi:hypothetical protein
MKEKSALWNQLNVTIIYGAPARDYSAFFRQKRAE